MREVRSMDSKEMSTKYISKGKVYIYRVLFWLGIVSLVIGILLGDPTYVIPLPLSFLPYLFVHPVFFRILGLCLPFFSFLAFRKQFQCTTFTCKGKLNNAGFKIYTFKSAFDDEYCPCCGVKYSIRYE